MHARTYLSFPNPMHFHHLRNTAKSLLTTTQLHASLLKYGHLHSNVQTTNHLITSYLTSHSLLSATHLLHQCPSPNAVTHTLLISFHLNCLSDPHAALRHFRDMFPTRPSHVTLSLVLKGCAYGGRLGLGSQVHGLCLKSGFGQHHVVVGNSLIHMYARCGVFVCARKVFEEMPERNVVSWNSMVGGCVLGGMCREAIALFREMVRCREAPDEFSFSSALKACGRVGALCQGSHIHAVVVVGGLVNEVLAGALVDLYVKCGRLEEAKRVFDLNLSHNSQVNVVAWTTLIVGHANEGLVEDCVDLLRRLWAFENTQIDEFVLSSAIGVFADFAMVEQGKQLHCYSVKSPFGFDVSVGNSLVDLYLKCGLTDEAERKFEEMSAKNVVSWTVMINGYGKNGLGHNAMRLFQEMKKEGVESDEVTHLALLSACSHAGLVTECWEHYRILEKEKFKSLKVEHYACMVDLLGRAGQLREAKEFIEKMPVEPNAAIWQTLLSACRVHKDVEMGRYVGRMLLNLDGENPANYVVFSNIFADAGEWEECEKLRETMKRKKLKKQGGCSWIEIEKHVHFFYGGDDSHPMKVQIREALAEVERRMREEIGYHCGVRFAMHDVEEESKEDSLRVHSEKLAVGLGLVCGGLNSGEVIRVYKNLRICGDCHEFMKGVSKVLRRVLVIRDANRFHKFENGKCSCDDYW